MTETSLLPIEPRDWPESLLALTKSLVTSSGNTVAIFKVLANNPVLFRNMMSREPGNLALLEREVIVNRVLYRLKNDYEKAGHKKMFLRAGGDPAVLQGLLDPWLTGLQGKDRCLAMTTDELLDHRAISPETRERLGEWFDRATIVEILALVAEYQFFTTLVNTSNLQIEETMDAVSTELMDRIFASTLASAESEGAAEGSAAGRQGVE